MVENDSYADTTSVASKKKIAHKKKKVKNSLRDSEDNLSNRELLANALEETAQNDAERKKLEQYKAKVNEINEVAVFVGYNNGSREGVAVVEFDCEFDNEAIGEEFGETRYHTVVTAFEPDVERDGEKFDYLVDELLENPNNYELEIKEDSPTEVPPGRNIPTPQQICPLMKEYQSPNPKSRLLSVTPKTTSQTENCLPMPSWKLRRMMQNGRSSSNIKRRSMKSTNLRTI